MNAGELPIINPQPRVTYVLIVRWRAASTEDKIIHCCDWNLEGDNLYCFITGPIPGRTIFNVAGYKEILVEISA